MAGTKEGGKKAAITNREKHGADFYARIGAIGGRNSTTGGFANGAIYSCGYGDNKDHKLAVCSGAKGGTISRRGKAVRI